MEISVACYCMEDIATLAHGLLPGTGRRKGMLDGLAAERCADRSYFSRVVAVVVSAAGGGMEGRESRLG